MAVLYKTDADVLDAVIAHFDTPRVKYGWNTKTDCCVYRAPNGARCAVGCLIPDEVYDPEWDRGDVLWGGTKSAEQILKSRKVSRLFGKRVNLQLLTDLQQLHDDYAQTKEPIAEFRKALRGFRTEWLTEQAAA